MPGVGEDMCACGRIVYLNGFVGARGGNMPSIGRPGDRSYRTLMPAIGVGIPVLERRFLKCGNKCCWAQGGKHFPGPGGHQSQSQDCPAYQDPAAPRIGWIPLLSRSFLLLALDKDLPRFGL